MYMEEAQDQFWILSCPANSESDFVGIGTNYVRNW